MVAVVELNGVTKRYKTKTAVDTISLAIEKGTITAILGPNGAGKSTILSVMLGIMEPTEGNVKVFGKDPKSLPVRQKIGAMMQNVSVMDGLKAKELIQLFRAYYPIKMDMEELISLTSLNETDLNKYAEELSGGQQRALMFALALAGNPELLILDEPTVGLDPVKRQLFWEKIKSFAAKGKTILFSTHYLQEADDVADRMIVFKEGSIVADGTSTEIKSTLISSEVSFQIDSSVSLEKLQQLSVVSGIYKQENRTFVITSDPDRVLACIFHERLAVSNIKFTEGRLDTAIEQLTLNKEVIKG